MSGLAAIAGDFRVRVGLPRVRQDHPLRVIRKIAAALASLDEDLEVRGRARVDAAFTLALAAYNLIRLPKLLAVQYQRPGQVAHPRDTGLHR